MSDATHICAQCGALWRWVPDDGSGAAWSLKSPTCGACCDNAEMGLQIIPLADADGIAAELEMTREDAAALEYADRLAQAERDARGSCAACKHYKPDPEAGRRYFGEPNADSGWCTNPDVRPAHKDDQYADMLSGDWCQSFERSE